MLMTGQIDGIIGDDCILEGYMNDYLKIINKTYSRENYAVATRKSDNSQELLNEVNAAITSLLDEKKLNIIKREYIKK